MWLRPSTKNVGHWFIDFIYTVYCRHFFFSPSLTLPWYALLTKANNTNLIAADQVNLRPFCWTPNSPSMILSYMIIKMKWICNIKLTDYTIYIRFVNISLHNFYWFTVTKYQICRSRTYLMSYSYIVSVLYVIAYIWLTRIEKYKDVWTCAHT